MPPKYSKNSTRYTEPLRMGVSTGSWGAPLPIGMILVLATLMRMAISDAQKSTTFNISTNFPASVLNRTMLSAYNNTTNGGKKQRP